MVAAVALDFDLATGVEYSGTLDRYLRDGERQKLIRKCSKLKDAGDEAEFRKACREQCKEWKTAEDSRHSGAPASNK